MGNAEATGFGVNDGGSPRNQSPNVIRSRLASPIGHRKTFGRTRHGSPLFLLVCTQQMQENCDAEIGSRLRIVLQHHLKESEERPQQSDPPEGDQAIQLQEKHLHVAQHQSFSLASYFRIISAARRKSSRLAANPAVIAKSEAYGKEIETPFLMSPQRH